MVSTVLGEGRVKPALTEHLGFGVELVGGLHGRDDGRDRAK